MRIQDNGACAGVLAPGNGKHMILQTVLHLLAAPVLSSRSGSASFAFQTAHYADPANGINDNWNV